MQSRRRVTTHAGDDDNRDHPQAERSERLALPVQSFPRARTSLSDSLALGR